MTVISGTLIGPYGEALPGVTIEMVAVRTTATVLEQASSRFVTDTNGRYSLKVEPGRYNVMVSASGQPAARVGSIIVELTSSTGTLNDFLTFPTEEDITPEIVKAVDRMRAEAANSAAAAKVSETNASAAMTNALSKVVSTDQSVASAVNFSKTVTSRFLLCAQATAPETNATLRFIDTNGTQQGALYSTTATGEMVLRWGGVQYSATFKADGTTMYPGNVYVGTARLLTEATQLGTQDLNTVVDEKRYFQNSTANATLERHYPVTTAGTLEVINSHAQASGRIGVTQNYYVWNVVGYYYTRTYLALSDKWTDWDLIEGRSRNDTRYVKIGDYGIGAVGMSLAEKTTGFIAQATSTGLAPANGAGFQSAYMPNRRCQLFIGTDGKVVSRFSMADTPETDTTQWNTHYTTANTTVDANGFIKKASPIVKLFGDGSSELNEESLGVTTERIGQGVYRVSGVLGFNGDGAWGGHGNGIEIPVDDNKRALIWVESKVLPDGDIEVRTYHRTYDTGPYSARNIKAMDSGDVDQKNIPIFVEMPDGTPVDIPAGRFIDLRVEMPTVDEPEPELEPEPEIEPELGAEPEQAAPTEPLVPEVTPEPEVPVEPTVPELNPEPGVDSEPSSAVGEEGVEQDRPVSERKPIF